MQLHSDAAPPVYRLFEIGDIEFREALRQAVVPIASALHLSIGVRTTDNQVEWLVTDLECECSSELREGDRECSCAQGRRSESIPINLGGSSAVSSCWLCSPTSAIEIREAICRIIEATSRQIAIEGRESSLLVELGTCWESLEALYEVYSLAPASRSIEGIVDRILSRLVDSGDGLCSAFWIEIEGQLVPLGGSGIADCGWLAQGNELLRRAMSEHRCIVIDASVGDHRPFQVSLEIDAIGSMLIVPVEARHGLKAALALWGPGGRKPFDSWIMRKAQALAMQAVMAIEGDQLNRAAVESELLHHDLDLGSRMQQMLLLGNQPTRLGFAQVASLAIPSQRVGGDFVEFFRQHRQCLDILIGDVMGKGLKASLVGAAVTRQFHRTLLALMSSQPDRLPSLETVVSLVHEEIAGRLADLDSFVTLNYARIDARRGRIEFIDCGHTPVLHYNRKEQQCSPLRGDNMPLGFSNKESYKHVTASYEYGDVFVFYSDGVTDVRNPEGEMFDIHRLMNLIDSSYQEGDPEALAITLRRVLTEFAGGDHFDDDLTFIVVETQIPERHVDRSRVKTIEITSELARLQEIRTFVRSMCFEDNDLILDQDRISMLELAVTEAASNIMIHAYDRRSDRWIRVEGELNDECMIIRLVHSGIPFNPVDIKPPIFDGTKAGGFGVYLIDRCVDDRYYVSSGRGMNAVTLIQKRDNF